MTGWNRSLTSRLRVLLHAEPLLDIKRSDAGRDPKLRHYEALPLAVKVLDLIIDRIGIDRELDREAILHALTPLLSEMDRAANMEPSAERHDAMVDRLLADLRNDAARRRPFKVSYKDFDENGRVVERLLEFNLVEEHFDLENRVVLKLSNEAINLYLRALDLEIEDAQAAAEAVLESQLKRGRLTDALESAKTANLQSVRFKEKIAGIRRDTQRDLRRVDWRESVPRLLEQALNHITLRLGIEKSILDATEKQRGELEGEKAAQIAQIWRLVEDCRVRHTELQSELMKIRNVFLDEQQRQAFSLGVTRSRTPEPVADLLEPLLRLDAKRSADLLSGCAPAFLGSRAPSMLSLRHLVGDLLRPRRPHAPEDAPLTEAELTEIEAVLQRFPVELRARAHRMIEALPGPVTLSSLLKRVDEDNGPADLKNLLVLLSLHHFAPEDGSTAPLRVERHRDGTLETSGFSGDELHLTPMEMKS